MIPSAMSCFGQLQAVSTRGETVKFLIIKTKSTPVSLFHRFREQGLRNSNGARGPQNEIGGQPSPKTVKQRNRERFTTQYQLLGCFTLFETA